MNLLKLFCFAVLVLTTLSACNGEKDEMKTETETETENNNNNNDKDRYTYDIEISLDGEDLGFKKLSDRHTTYRMFKDGIELSFRTDEEKFKQIGFIIYTENPEISNATDIEIIDAASAKSYGLGVMSSVGSGGYTGFSCDGSLQITKSSPQEIIMTFDAMLYGIDDIASGLCPTSMKGKISLKTSFEREIIDVNLIN